MPTAYDAPCEFGVDLHGKEILVLRVVQQRHLPRDADADGDGGEDDKNEGQSKEVAALREMASMGVISMEECDVAIAEAVLRARAAALVRFDCVRVTAGRGNRKSDTAATVCRCFVVVVEGFTFYGHGGRLCVALLPRHRLQLTDHHPQRTLKLR